MKPKKITDQFDNQADVVKKAKNGGARKLQANEIEALWDQVIAIRMATFKWTPVQTREGSQNGN